MNKWTDHPSGDGIYWMFEDNPLIHGNYPVCVRIEGNDYRHHASRDRFRIVPLMRWMKIERPEYNRESTAGSELSMPKQRYRLNARIPIVVTRKDPNFDRACDMAPSMASVLFGIDADGHAANVDDWERSSCSILVALIREKHGLSAQLTVRAIGKAVECFKRDKAKCPVFNPRSAVVYDERIMRFIGLEAVNLGTIDGRITIPIVVSGYQSDKLQAPIKTGQADLVYVDGIFYLLLSVQFEDVPQRSASKTLGIDLGVNEIAVDSEGNAYTGADVEQYRIRMQTLRSSLQSRGTRSAKRHLRKIRRKESNYRRTKNHQISRSIVNRAKAQNCSIAIEDLKGIGKRTRFRKEQRARMAGWAFHQLREFI